MNEPTRAAPPDTAHGTRPAFTTRAVHAGESPADHLGALATPIYPASVHRFESAEQGAAIHEGDAPGYFYGRIANPTQSALETAMADLEGGEAALATASGMAAISATLLALLNPGDHVVAPRSMYPATIALMRDLLRPMGIGATFVDGRAADAYACAITPETKVLYVESPSNPLLHLTDLGAVASLARKRGLTTVADNTFASPFNQRPLEHGIDVVVHSATKYLGGHGDLMAGIIAGPAEILRAARWRVTRLLGGVIAPHTAWLVLRGLKTLALRMERHNHNAMSVASFLERHPRVGSVSYPGLSGHPQHDLARRMLSGFGGVLSFDLGGIEEGRRFVNSLKLCTLAVSLGDVATLVQHSASMTHASMTPQQRADAGVTDGLIRLSVGIEEASDIIDDLDRALAFV